MTQETDELRQQATRLGLSQLSETHLAQFARARAAAERMLSRIPRDLHMYEEPAHTYRASEETSA
jgi:hypothetical protein